MAVATAERESTATGAGVDRVAEAERLEGEIAEVCGVLNAASGRLVRLIADVLATEAWEGWGIRSPEHWVGWRCGVSPTRARRLVAMAQRVAELPETMGAFEAGELAEDQVAVVARHAPPHADADMAVFAREASVTQLGRVLRSYVWGTENTGEDDDEAGGDDKAGSDDKPGGQPENGPEHGPERRVTFGYGDDGSWSLWAHLDPDEGALVERALDVARRELEAEGGHPSWSDALVAMADRSLSDGASSRPATERHLVLLHLEEGSQAEVAANLHLGPPLAGGLWRLLTCDGRVRPVLERDGVALSVGRALRIVPERTRIAVEHRDGGCRLPGCDRRGWLQIHHVRHWSDGGPTDTANLVCLCAYHHRLHHQGKLGIAGDADDPDGLVFTDANGRRLTGRGRPAPPGPTTAADLGLAGTWRHPSGEHLDLWAITFREPSPN